MNYVKIKYPDVANGPGVRASLFVSGCTRRCLDCFNPETWDPKAGQPYTSKTEERLLNLLSRSEVAGLSILGGEPLTAYNLPAVCTLVRRAKSLRPAKPLWIWSGYTYEELLDRCRLIGGYRAHRRAAFQLQEVLALADVLVDGPYIAAERDLTLQFRGSRNQRIIDLRQTQATGEIVLWADAQPSVSNLSTIDYVRRRSE